MTEKYLVESPMMYLSGGYYEPPEYDCCVVWVDARSKRDAINKAIGMSEFHDWVLQARGDNRPPQADVKATSESELLRLEEEYDAIQNI